MANLSFFVTKTICMKYILLSTLVLLLTNCASFTPAEIENGKVLGVMPMQYGRISYQTTAKVNASREDIFRQVRRWAAFNSTRTVYVGPAVSLKVPAPTNALNIGDNMLGDIISSGTTGTILRNSRSSVFWPAANYSTSIECFDGFYRVTLTNFYTLGLPSPHNLELRDKQTSRKIAKEYYTKLDEHINDLLNELNVFVRTELRGVKN